MTLRYYYVVLGGNVFQNLRMKLNRKVFVEMQFCKIDP
jgi:hypothetical protein